MHVAGIYFSDEKLVECIATSTLFIYTALLIRKKRNAPKLAGEKGGKIKPKPTPLVGLVAMYIPPITIFPPLLAYIVVVPLDGWRQPAFMTRWTLPDFGLDANAVNVLRVVASLSFIGIWKLYSYFIDVLDQSFHGMGVRERPKLVSTGPYAIVRHPLYTLAIVQEAAFAMVSWNYVPLYALAACALALLVKIPVEESLIESDSDIGAEYVEYKKKVRYRLVPGVW